MSGALPIHKSDQNFDTLLAIQASKMRGALPCHKTKTEGFQSCLKCPK